MLNLAPGRPSIDLENLSELDSLYIVGSADAGSAIWHRDNYPRDRQYLIVLHLLSQSPHSTTKQKHAANRHITKTMQNRESKVKGELCLKRRAEFAKNRNAIRLALIDRDGFGCTECSVQDDITIDHIMPLSRGGIDSLGNLRFLCRSCNSKKNDRLPADVAAALDSLGL